MTFLFYYNVNSKIVRDIKKIVCIKIVQEIIVNFIFFLRIFTKYFQSFKKLQCHVLDQIKSRFRKYFIYLFISMETLFLQKYSMVIILREKGRKECSVQNKKIIFKGKYKITKQKKT